jgi:methionine synthase / methylenetetrahydrofolate reductase (NADH)
VDRTAFRALLEREPLLGDGGTGTSLVAAGVPLESCFDALNLEAPDQVLAVHTSFVDAGSRVIETNTWGANHYKLAQHGLADKLREVNEAGVALARTAGVLVAGSIGPLGVRLAPYGRVQPSEAFDAFADQAAALSSSDFLIIETLVDLAEVEQAVRAARAATDLPIVATMSFTRDDRTLLGSTPEEAAILLASLGVDALGVNCSEGPAQVLRLLTAIRPHAKDIPLVAQPNAGGPARVAGRLLYPATSEYFGEHVREFVAAGARFVGGCCGTGPAHIHAMALALASPASAPEVRVLGEPEERPAAAATPAPSRLARVLADGTFAVAVEMDPPRGASAARMLAGAETVAAAGADVIDVADSPMARMRMSPWAACHLIQQEAGIETVLHFPTRGRNLLRVQGDLLAAYALGIRNIFACMGDPTAIGDYPNAADTMDVVPSGLVRLIKEQFNTGRDRTGASIGEATSFVVGVALNLNATDVAREATTFHKKISAGADFALSQPVYDLGRLARFRAAYEERFGELRLPILVGLLPLVTDRHAEFLHNEVPGIDVPETVRDQLRHAGDGAEGVGLQIATELTGLIREQAAGIYLMPPFGRYDLAAEVVERARKL